MITQCISAFAVLAIVTIGLLVMVQAITVEVALQGIGRVVAMVVLLLCAWCLVRGLFQTIFVPWLQSLLSVLGWVFAGSLVLILVVLAVSAFGRRFKKRQSHISRRGEP